jgi:hypothetical protein
MSLVPLDEHANNIALNRPQVSCQHVELRLFGRPGLCICGVRRDRAEIFIPIKAEKIIIIIMMI